jgi:cytochrome P450 / NADPH-cytochrome P450 reductase
MCSAAVMHETLRLHPTAPQRGVTAKEDTTIGNGKYAIQNGWSVVLSVYNIHRDPAVWGEDVSP